MKMFSTGMAILGVLGALAPLLPLLALVPWYFVAVHRGLMRRSKIRFVLSIASESIHVQRGAQLPRSHALAEIVRARFAQNDNWTESKLLEDALSLFDKRDREVVRIPESAEGFSELLDALNHRGIAIEYIGVSAPAYLD